MGIYRLTPEEREQQRLGAVRDRMRVLGTIVVIAVLARVFIKNPDVIKKADHTKDANVRVLPGVYDRLNPDHRNKISPEVLAKLQAAHKGTRFAQSVTASAPAVSAPESSASQTSAPAPVVVAQQSAPSDTFIPPMDTGAFKKPDIPLLPEEEMKWHRINSLGNDFKWVDTSKKMLVRFKSGGFVKAREAEIKQGKVDIRIDQSLLASLPRHLVTSVSADGLTWQEPIPSGYKKIRPAPGITVILSENTAKRITVPKVEKKDEDEHDI